MSDPTSQSTAPAGRMLAVDIGNSGIKFALMDGREIAHRFRMASPASGKDVAAWLSMNLSTVASESDVIPCVIASVSPPVTELLREPLSDLCQERPLVLGEDEAVPIENRTNKPEQVGIDRLVNALASREIVGSPSIVVDFGSAVTFDLVSSDGAYLGGVITPGIELALRALADNTALLPLVKPEGRPPVIGKDTVTAINSGIYHGYVGLVQNVIHQLREELGDTTPVVATGGDGAYLATEIPEISQVLPDLTMQGIQLAWIKLKA